MDREGMMAEQKIHWNSGKEYISKENLERALERYKIPERWRYLVVANPNNGKLRPIFIVDREDGQTQIIRLPHLGFMIVG